MTDEHDGFPSVEAFAEFAASAHEYDCVVVLIEEEGEERSFTSRFEDEDGRLHEMRLPVDSIDEGQAGMLTHGARFILRLTPEDSGTVDGQPIAKHEVTLEFLPPEVIPQEEIDAALAIAKARRARRAEERPL